MSPIHKKNDPSDVSNYRPISLLSTVSKVLEKLCINIFLSSFETITSLQLFSGDSTVSQLIDIYNTFCKALDEGKEVRAIFCDISIKPLIEFGIKVFFLNFNLQVYLDRC